MKLLVVTNGKTEADFPAIKQIADHLDIPYDVLDMSTNTGRVTPSICMVDPKTTPRNIRNLKAYGAKIDLVSERDPVTGEFLQARFDRVQTSYKRSRTASGPARMPTF
jgi:hypothetical protein